MIFSCPTCGQAVSERLPPEKIIAATPLSPLELRIVAALPFDQVVTRGRLSNRVFSNHRPGRERTRSGRLSYGLMRLNQKLNPRGITVESLAGNPHTHRLTWLTGNLRCETCGDLYPANMPRRTCHCGGRLVPMPLTLPASESQAA